MLCKKLGIYLGFGCVQKEVITLRFLILQEVLLIFYFVYWDRACIKENLIPLYFHRWGVFYKKEALIEGLVNYLISCKLISSRQVSHLKYLWLFYCLKQRALLILWPTNSKQKTRCCGLENERNTSKGKRNRTNRTDFCIKYSSGRELIVPAAFLKEKFLSFSQKRYGATSIRFIKISIGNCRMIAQNGKCTWHQNHFGYNKDMESILSVGRGIFWKID